MQRARPWCPLCVKPPLQKQKDISIVIRLNNFPHAGLDPINKSSSLFSFPSKAILDGLTKPCNRCVHVLGASRSKSGTEMQAWQRSVLFGGKP